MVARTYRQLTEGVEPLVKSLDVVYRLIFRADFD
jgi:hypothetical protein